MPFARGRPKLLGLPGKDWMLCGNGSDDILTICTRAFVGQGDLLRLPYPSYILYRTLAQLQGARWEEVRFDADWSLPRRLRRSRRPGLKLAFLPNPNSPTGTMVRREAMLELAERLPCPLLVDEAYVDFADFNCVDLVARNEKILVSRTLSKSYGLAGLRFGYLVAQPQMIEQLDQGQGFVQLRFAVDRRRDRRHRRPRLAGRESRQNRRHPRPADGGPDGTGLRRHPVAS